MLAVLMIVMIFTILKSAHFKTMEYTLLMYWPLTIHNITYYAHVTKDEGKNFQVGGERSALNQKGVFYTLMSTLATCVSQ